MVFESDHLYMVLKLSVVLGDASDKHNTAFSSRDHICMCSSWKLRVVLRHWCVIRTYTNIWYVQGEIYPCILLKDDVVGCFVQLMNT